MRTGMGPLKLMANRPIAIAGDGADGSAVGPGGVESGPSNEHGGDGPASINGSFRQFFFVWATATTIRSPPFREREPVAEVTLIPSLCGVRDRRRSKHHRLGVCGTFCHDGIYDVRVVS